MITAMNYFSQGLSRSKFQFTMSDYKYLIILDLARLANPWSSHQFFWVFTRRVKLFCSLAFKATSIPSAKPDINFKGFLVGVK